MSTEVTRLLADLDAIHPLLQSEAADSERLRRPTPAVQTALRGIGIHKLTVPAELGGMDASPVQVLQVMEKLAHADASLGWLVGALAAETATAAVHLGDAAAAELFADGACPVVSGQSAAFTGRAVRTDGGYRISGAWQFTPGVSLATHVNLAATVEETGEQLVGLVPRSAVRISDNWDMLGLRATASFDYQADDVPVDDAYVYRTGPGHARRGGPLYRSDPALPAVLQQAAWAQGIGRRMLDELRALTRRRNPAEQAPVTRDEFFAEFARHYSHARGTMALLRETWADNEATLAAGMPLDGEQETMARLAGNLATSTALEIGQLVYRFAGAQVMRDGTVQRFFRDSHAGSRHRGSSDAVTRKCGRMLSGTAPEGTCWDAFDLIAPQPAGAHA